MIPSEWCQGTLDDLEIEDDVTFGALRSVPWMALRLALRDVTFCWPTDVDAMPSAWEDLARQSNLLNWHPGDAHELLRSDAAGADELCHLAVHKLIFGALDRPEDWRSWLFAEAAASATDVLVLGALLNARCDSAFVPMQVEVLQVCWDDAGRDEDALAAALLILAADPVAVWREVVALIEDHVTEQRGLIDVRASAAAFALRVAEPWGPLLLHFQTAWWVAAVRMSRHDAAPGADLNALRSSLFAATSPLDTLVLWNAGCAQ